MPKMPSMPKMPGEPPKNRDRELGPEDPTILALVERALAERLIVTARYIGENGETYHEFYPLALGQREGRHRVWAYQFAGDTESGWKCFRIAALHDVETRGGDWGVPNGDPGPARCFGTRQAVRSTG